MNEYSSKKSSSGLFHCFSDDQSGVLIFCDDPSVEKAAHSAVSKLNEWVTVGHKMALYQILSATKVQHV